MEEDESVLRGDKGREEETFWLSSNKLNCFKKLVLLIIVTLKILYIYYLRWLVTNIKFHMNSTQDTLVSRIRNLCLFKIYTR